MTSAPSKALPSIPELPDDARLRQGTSLLTLGAVGVVFGDLGTSPLYAFKAAFAEELFHNSDRMLLASKEAHVLGALSLFVWAIIIVICLKYVLLMMRADNDGEGGVLAMFTLLIRSGSRRASSTGGSALAAKVGLAMLAITGAALLYGDGVVTPAISVLSAAEGINVATGGATPVWVAPLCAVVVLVGLFSMQRFGTGAIGALFGPVMLVWFIVIAALGIGGILQNPEVLRAINPMWGVALFQNDPWLTFVLLGAVVLCVTGCEALSLDMGHFGRRPIRLAWFFIVCPSLLLNYFGQAGVLLSLSSVPPNPFYALVPEVVLIPMIVLSIMAAVIASQAIIAGAFSITRQAIQLLLLPPMRIRHTSKDQEGRIFVPLVNRWMLILSVVLVLSFHTSDRLGAAYGLAVSGVMVTSTIMLGLVAHRVWRWPVWVLVPVVLVLLVVDVAFLGANLLKIPSGGWVPLAIGLVMILLMTTWLRGMRLIQRTRSEDEIPLTTFLADVETAAPPRVAGGGVFLTRVDGVTPFSLQKLYHHMPVLHQEVIIVHFELMSRPRVPRSERVSVDDLGQGFYYLHCPIGYLQEPYLPRLLKAANQKGLPTHADRVTYYTRRDIPSSAVHDHRMSGWRKALLFTMLRNAWSPSDRLSVPSEQLIEIGVRLNF